MMTLDFNSQLEDTHMQVWDLLPWYVNGTLDENEQRLVKAHLLHCRRCHTELSRCQNTVRAVHRDREQSWQQKPDQLDRLFQQIDQLESVNSSTGQSGRNGFRLHFSRLYEWLEGNLSLPRWSLAVPAALAMALTAVLVFQSAPRESAVYGTLTSPGAALDVQQQRLQIIFSPDSTTSEITRLLQSLDVEARIIDGPTEQGRFTVAITADQSVELGKLASSLQSFPEVLFAQPQK